MLLKRVFNKMQQNSRNLVTKSVRLSTNDHNIQADYKNAIKALNSLQSNAEYIKVARKEKLSHAEEFSKTILQCQKYLIRSGISLETLDTLPVIHIAGTKGKGSTCALCESILRHHGLRTGFYSSPHLLEVRERIRINGVPITKQEFTKHFWHVYNRLNEHKSYPNDMPMYFKFLTVLAFRAFLMEKVDVAIIEVGIGGEYDSTNVLRNVPIVGITSLGLDHTSILGDTIEKIAWHKAGIMKPGSQVFTVPQPAAAMEVLKNRSIERNCSLQIVNSFQNLPVINTGGPANIFSMNFSLAITLAQAWMNLHDTNSNHKDIINSKATKLALSECYWFGRYQVLRTSNNIYYLDGAHTPESIKVCAEWFINQTNGSSHKRALIFNATGDRDSKDLMNRLRPCCFQKILFVPNRATANDSADSKNYNTPEDQQVARCHTHRDVWLELERTNNTYRKAELVKVLPSVLDALHECESDKYDILITGSLHLIGAALSIIDPGLKNCKNNDY